MLTVESRIFKIFSSLEELQFHLGIRPEGRNYCLLGAVVKELVDNAIDGIMEKSTNDVADEDSKVKVSIKMEKDKFLVEVYDNGKGIPKKVVKKISPKTLQSTKILSGRISCGRKGNALAIITGISSLTGKPLEIETNEFKAKIFFKKIGQKIIRKKKYYSKKRS